MREDTGDITIGFPRPEISRQHQDLVTDTLIPTDGFSSASWNELQRVIRRFEQDWREDKRPEIADYLPLGHVHRQAVLLELVLTELELRQKGGELATATEYLTRFPELGCDASVVSQLLAAESRWKSADTQVARPCTVTVPDETLGYDLTSTRLGKYELIEIVGRGSFGVVYRARDTELGRTVAIKVPQPGRLSTPQDADRFLREVRVTAKLTHPAIVPVHDAGRIDDTFYLVCEYVDGSTMAKHMARGALPPLAAAGLVARVAHALEHAHRQGIVHRDLKPSNILIDQSGQPRLTDFGLAKQDLDEATLTLDGQVLGTPAYMSPEQASGDARHADDRSDIYSLGVVLYQAITGELPFRGSPRMILTQILHEDPRPPSALNHQITRDLETTCLKAMARLPRDRYHSAAALADDLERFLRHEPIAARPITSTGRMWRRAQRQPLPFALAAALTLAIASGSIGVTWQWLQVRSALVHERRQSERAIAALRHANKVISTLSRVYGGRTSALRVPENELKDLISKQRSSINQLYNSYINLCEDDRSPTKDVVVAELTLAQFNQGVMLRACGSGNEAEQAFAKAGQLGEEQLRTRPNDLAVKSLLGDTCHHLAQLNRAQGRWNEARRFFERRAALLDEIAREISPAERIQLTIASALLDLGQAIIEVGAPADALHHLRRGLSQLEMEARNQSQSVVLRIALSDAHIQIGRALDRMDRPAEAIESFQQALAISENLVRGHPFNVAFRRRVGMCHHVLGNLYEDLSRSADAADCFRLALTIREALVHDYPKDAEYRKELIGTRTNLAESLATLGQEVSPTARRN